MNKAAHFKTYLIFYGVTVLSVLGLFRLTSAYGETYLKAPPNLNGHYLTNAAFPGCPAESRLAILIQQSGLYLNGALELTTPTTIATEPLPEQLTLGGDWQQQQIKLAGPTSALTECQPLSPPEPVSGQIQIQAAHQPAVASTPASLSGQLTLNGQPWAFTATQQATAAKDREH